jgi:hypothetical protein
LILSILFAAAGVYTFLNDMLNYTYISGAAAILMLIIFIIKKAKSKHISTDKIYKKYDFKNEYEFEKYCSLKNREYEKQEEAKILLQLKSDEYEKIKQELCRIVVCCIIDIIRHWGDVYGQK